MGNASLAGLIRREDVEVLANALARSEHPRHWCLSVARAKRGGHTHLHSTGENVGKGYPSTVHQSMQPLAPIKLRIIMLSGANSAGKDN